MASQSVTALRTYGGEQGDERVARRREQLMDAALEVLGSDDGGALSVRGVCREAKLTARYFYESFDSADDLVAAAFDRVVEEIGTAASEAFAVRTDIRTRAHGAVAAIVALIADDRRKGRLLFSPKLLSTPLVARRMAATRNLAALTVQTTAGSHHQPTEVDLAAAYYRVGGLGNLLAAWLDDRVQLEREELIDICTALLVGG